MGELKIQKEELFQELPLSESESILNLVFTKSIPLVGKCEDQTIVIVRPALDGSSHEQIMGVLKNGSRLKNTQRAVFSFVTNDSKYLFKGAISFLHGKLVSIKELSKIYCIQRRNNERLKIPEDYYAVLKITHINSRPNRNFGKVKNISSGGLAIVFRSEQPKFSSGDKIRGVLSLSCRPPEDIELKVKHVQMAKDGDTNLQIFGGAYLPENHPQLTRKMSSVITDIYRDLFKGLDPFKK